MPLSTYENIIPQRGKIVKRLTAVFKKNFEGFFFDWAAGVFCAECRAGYQHGMKSPIYNSRVYVCALTRNKD